MQWFCCNKVIRYWSVQMNIFSNYQPELICSFTEESGIQCQDNFFGIFCFYYWLISMYLISYPAFTFIMFSCQLFCCLAMVKVVVKDNLLEIFCTAFRGKTLLAVKANISLNTLLLSILFCLFWMAIWALFYSAL